MKNFTKKKSRGNSGEELLFSDVFKLVLSTLFIFCIISFAFLLISSFLTYRLENPTAWSRPVGRVALYVSALFSGIILSKRAKQKYVPSSMLLGALILVLVFVFSLIFTGDSEANNVLWLLLILPCTLTGGLLGIKRNKSHHKHKRNRYK